MDSPFTSLLPHQGLGHRARLRRPPPLPMGQRSTPLHRPMRRLWGVTAATVEEVEGEVEEVEGANGEASSSSSSSMRRSLYQAVH